MNMQSTTAQSSGKARLQLGLISALCVIGLAAAIRPYGGFSSGDTVRVPGLGERTPVELVLLALRTASAVFALWLLVSIVGSLVNLLRAHNTGGTASTSSKLTTHTSSRTKYASTTKLPRLFGPGWLQQLLRQAAGGTLALALLAGPASAVTRNPQAGTARTVLTPVASVLATENTTVQFAGDVTTGQRWPVLPETSEITATSKAVGPTSSSERVALPPATPNPTAATATRGTPAIPTSPNATTSPDTTSKPATTSNPATTAQSTSSSPQPTTATTATTATMRPTTTTTTTTTNATTTGEPAKPETVIVTTATPRASATAPSSAAVRTPSVPPATASTTIGDRQASAEAPTSTRTTSTPPKSAPSAPNATSAQRANLAPVTGFETPRQANAEQPATPKPIQSAPGEMTNPPVHVVQPGESFWAIAEHHVLARNPHADDHEIARYWEVLQAQNVQRLPAPGVPDLLFPGTELSLPPITG